MVCDLYIPFWSYSNCNKCNEKFGLTFFTFHFGHILMQSTENKDDKQLIFTFHFGHILILSEKAKEMGIKTLHSILVIF